LNHIEIKRFGSLCIQELALITNNLFTGAATTTACLWLHGNHVFEESISLNLGCGDLSIIVQTEGLGLGVEWKTLDVLNVVLFLKWLRAVVNT